MARRRVVITGLGVVTSLGESHDEMWDKICAGQSGITIIRRWNTEKYPVKIGGECLSFDIDNYKEEAAKYTEDRLTPRRIDRFGLFGIAASLSAVKDAGLDFEKEDRTRCGVIIGTGIGGIETIEEQYKILHGSRRKPGQPVHRPPSHAQCRQRKRLDRFPSERP